MKKKLLLGLVFMVIIVGHFMYTLVTEPSYEEIMNSFLPEIEEAMELYKAEYINKKELFVQLELSDLDVEAGNILVIKTNTQDGYVLKYYSDNIAISSEEFKGRFPETYKIGQTLNDSLSLFSEIGKNDEILFFSCPTIFKNYGWGIQIVISKNDDYIYDFSESLDNGWQIGYKIYPPA